MRTIALVGAASSAGAHGPGQERAPELFRKMGIYEHLCAAGLGVLDCGDIPTVRFEPDTNHPQARNLAKVVDVAHQVAGKVSTAFQQHAFPLVLGGDCTVTLGVLAGLQRLHYSLGLVYFDGDVDLNTPQTTHTGIFDGMGLAHIIGEGADELSRLGTRCPLVSEENVVLFGFNSDAGWMDPSEVEFLRQSSFVQYPVANIQGRVGQMAAEVLPVLEERVDGFLVHFDVDVVDYEDLPVGDVPHRGGLSMREAAEALRVFVSSARCAGLVITEFNAERDVDGVHAKRLTDEIVRILADPQMR